MVELAVIPTGTIRLGQVQHRHPVLLGERVDLAAKPVADPLDYLRRRDRPVGPQSRSPISRAMDQRRHLRVEPAGMRFRPAGDDATRSLDDRHIAFAQRGEIEGRLVDLSQDRSATS
jgi:hypothetical protein